MHAFIICFRDHTVQQLKLLEQVIGQLRPIKEVHTIHLKEFHWCIGASLKLIWTSGLDKKVHSKIMRVSGPCFSISFHVITCYLCVFTTLDKGRCKVLKNSKNPNIKL